jgi:hypothetical protein
MISSQFESIPVNNFSERTTFFSRICIFSKTLITGLLTNSFLMGFIYIQVVGKSKHLILPSILHKHRKKTLE